MKTDKQAIIVKSQTRQEQLTAKFNTISQARFYIEQAQKSFYASKKGGGGSRHKKSSREEEPEPDENITGISEYQEEHDNFYRALDALQKNLSGLLKTKIVDKDFLPTYLFSENDILIVVGRDGLVANTAKYAKGLPIFGVNPDASRYDGVLLPFTPANIHLAVANFLQNKALHKEVTMAEAVLNDGQRLLAFNDLFVGMSSHQSSRYKIDFAGREENHSSSGIIISTGAGSTGWLSSLFNMANAIQYTFGKTALPQAEHAMEWDDKRLVFVVREPFRSKYSQIGLSAGIIDLKNPLIIESQMPENGIIFSDGIQSDYVRFNSGTIASIGIAPEKAILVLA